MRKQQFRSKHERGDAMVSLLIFAVAIVGLVGIVVSNPNTLSQLISDQSIKDKQTFTSIAAKGFTVFRINPDGSKSLDITPGGLVEQAFQNARNTMQANGVSNEATTCSGIYLAQYNTLCDNTSGTMALQVGPGDPTDVAALCIANGSNPHCEAAALNALQDPCEPTFIGCMYDYNNGGQIEVLPAVLSDKLS